MIQKLHFSYFELYLINFVMLYHFEGHSEREESLNQLQKMHDLLGEKVLPQN